MSNELAILTDEEINAFAARSGAESSGSGNFTPTLKVNYDEEDADGNEIKKGLFMVTNQDVTVYAKTVKFRPLTQHFQWMQYDDVAKKVTNKTILVPTLFDEARDEKGTVKCGKPSSKDLKANPALAKKYEDITTFRRVHGLVSYTGEDAKGGKHTIENMVVCLTLKGANFSPFEEEFFSKIGKARIWEYDLDLSVTREKNGASTFFVIHFSTDFANKVQLNRAVFDTAVAIQENIDKSNEEIEAKYFKALRNKDSDADAENIMKDVSGNRPGKFSADLNADMDDDIPF